MLHPNEVPLLYLTEIKNRKNKASYPNQEHQEPVHKPESATGRIVASFPEFIYCPATFSLAKELRAPSCEEIGGIDVVVEARLIYEANRGPALVANNSITRRRAIIIPLVRCNRAWLELTARGVRARGTRGARKCIAAWYRLPDWYRWLHPTDVWAPRKEAPENRFAHPRGCLLNTAEKRLLRAINATHTAVTGPRTFPRSPNRRKTHLRFVYGSVVIPWNAIASTETLRWIDFLWELYV